SFGGPEKKEDVIPFLENVLRGRNVPRERMLEVAEHYYHFGGVSPINDQVRALLDAVIPELKTHGIDLPVYWGNRNWHPMLTDTMAEMQAAGVRRALAFFTAAYSSYSGCRQYRENVLDAQAQLGDGAPVVEKVRMFFNHPDFIAANADHLRAAIAQLPDANRDDFQLAFTAHSIPNSMSAGCDYVKQLEETCRLLAEELQIPQERWQLVYQSRSGRPEDPWLEPDILDHIRDLQTRDIASLVIAPIGFLSDHMEVLFDLDEEAALLCQELGITMSRAASVGTHPRFVTMIRKLIQERLDPSTPKEAIGQYGPNWDVCPEGCCPAPRRPGRPSAAT
ncbi:MAG: ferrochelatase, partial [Planctomycetaceae bacterium]|nr:ferrochelatase [Planctomycetaceae bacterium]